MRYFKVSRYDPCIFISNCILSKILSIFPHPFYEKCDIIDLKYCTNPKHLF
jgi:hypothetical protein